MLFKFKHLKVKMNVKIHYLFRQLDKFSENLGNSSEEHWEKFDQNSKQMGCQYDD